VPAAVRAFRPAPYRLWLSAAYLLAVGVGGVAALASVLLLTKPSLPWPAILAFALLSFLAQRSTFHLGTPALHSLVGVIDLAAVLALGPAAGACAAALSGFLYLELYALRRRRVSALSLLPTPLFVAGLKAAMALVTGWILFGLGGWAAPAGLPEADGPALAGLGVTCLAWFLMDHAGWGVWDFLQGGVQQVRLYLRSAWPVVLFMELVPLPFSAVLALVFLELPPLAFALMAAAIAGAALLVQRWGDGRIELTQRVAELSAVEELGRAIAQAQLDIDELCTIVYEHASRIADTTLFHLGLFEDEDYVIRLWMREGVREPQRTFRMEPGVGLVNWMRASRQPLLVRDFEREVDSLPARPVYVDDRPPHSALFVPLRAGEIVIGTLSAQSYRQDAYGESDLRVLSAMASQAAVAIQKARLYAQERKRALQLDTIGEVVRQVSGTLKLAEVFRHTVHRIRDSFGYSHVALFTADPQAKQVAFQASASAGQREVTFEVEWGQGLIGWVAASGATALAGDVTQDDRFRRVGALDETRSEVAVPLCAEQELVGVLDVQSDRLNAFGTDDLYILETLGAQVAAAIQKARLYEAEQQQAWLSTALLQVTEALTHLTDMDEVLTTIVRLTPMLVGVERCGILLLDADTDTFLPAHAYGLSPDQREQFEHLAFAPGDMAALDLIRQERTALLVSSAEHPDLVPPHLARVFRIGEMALLPLVAQGELLGAMLADFGEAQPFRQKAMAVLTSIASQAAMVVQSAHLLQAQREEAYVSMALLQVADAVGRSGELSDALAAVVRITPMLVGVEACALFLWDPEAVAFVPSQEYGLTKETQALFWQLLIAPDDPIALELLSGTPYVNVQDLPHLARRTSAAGHGSFLMLPVSIRGDVVGMMGVDCSGPVQRITQRRMGILNGIANQVGIAVENHRLLEEAAEQERMKKELEVARRIQTSFLPECCPYVPGWELASVWRSAREVAGDFYDFIPIAPDSARGAHEGRTGVVVADVADKGVPAALFMALSRTLLRTMAIGGRSPSAAVAQTNNLILADTRSELFVTLFYAILDPNTGAIVYVNAGHMPPLLVRAADGSMEELRTGDMAIGVLPDEEYQERTAVLEAGDTLILYTDGLVDAMDGEGQMFGRQRLKQVVAAHRSAAAQELAGHITDAVDAHVGDSAQFDDLTLVVARRRGHGESPAFGASGRSQAASDEAQQAG
jgi:serine phosphatase RsbU (regulator of sigma subunit)/signal transduction protein with GAF and PtsI domain